MLSEDAYVIVIELSDELITHNNKQLKVTQNMKRTEEIIIEDTHLLQEIVDPFRYLLTKNKSKCSYFLLYGS